MKPLKCIVCVNPVCGHDPRNLYCAHHTEPATKGDIEFLRQRIEDALGVKP